MTIYAIGILSFIIGCALLGTLLKWDEDAAEGFLLGAVVGIICVIGVSLVVGLVVLNAWIASVIWNNFIYGSTWAAGFATSTITIESAIWISCLVSITGSITSTIIKGFFAGVTEYMKD